MATDTASLKFHIFVDKKKNRVLFAEAGKDFVDFILHILTLPLGAVARILSDASNFGSIGTLREGLNTLDDKCIESSEKQYLMDVKAPCFGKQISQLLPDASYSKLRTFYRCNSWINHIKQDPCNSNSSGGCCSLIQFLSGSLIDVRGSERGYVKGWVTFMVMDDLTVRASAVTAAFSLLDVLSIKDIGAIEKREVTFGTNEAISLLKASLSSKTVLTDVFLADHKEAVVKAEKK